LKSIGDIHLTCSRFLDLNAIWQALIINTQNYLLHKDKAILNRIRNNHITHQDATTTFTSHCTVYNANIRGLFKWRTEGRWYL